MEDDITNSFFDEAIGINKIFYTSQMFGVTRIQCRLHVLQVTVIQKG